MSRDNQAVGLEPPVKRNAKFKNPALAAYGPTGVWGDDKAGCTPRPSKRLKPTTASQRKIIKEETKEEKDTNETGISFLRAVFSNNLNELHALMRGLSDEDAQRIVKDNVDYIISVASKKIKRFLNPYFYNSTPRGPNPERDYYLRMRGNTNLDLLECAVRRRDVNKVDNILYEINSDEFYTDQFKKIVKYARQEVKKYSHRKWNITERKFENHKLFKVAEEILQLLEDELKLVVGSAAAREIDRRSASEEKGAVPAPY